MEAGFEGQLEVGTNLIRCGDEAEPIRKFQIRVAQDLKSLLISSSEQETQEIPMNCAQLTALGVFFSGSKVRVMTLDRGTDPAEFDFALDGSTRLGGSQMELGDAGDKRGTPPFIGTIGGVMLFDRDICDDWIKASTDERKLFLYFMKLQPALFLEAVGRENERKFAASLIGVALPAQKRFEFVPREILWPEGEPARWMMNDGDQQPTKIMLAASTDGDQGIYASNVVYCFVRVLGKPYLWSDGGHQFELSWLGGNQFEGKEAAGRKIKLTYKPSPEDPTMPAIMEVEFAGGWKNTVEHVFPIRVCPAGGTLASAITNDILWPDDFYLKCIPADFNTLNLVQGKKDQDWAGAFAKVPFAISHSMQGWNVALLDNPFNPGSSSAANKDNDHLLFEPPPADSKDYRMEHDHATPYYCTVAPIVQGSSETVRHSYRSAGELSHKQSNSFGLGLSDGKESLFDFSFESVMGNTTRSSAEHSIILSQSAAYTYSIVLEKQWLKLNSKFVRDLKRDVETLENANDPYARMFSLFDKWGTHYPNAVTYGSGDYSLGLIDEVTASRIVSSSDTTSLSAGIPIEDVMAKGKVSWGKEDGEEKETSNNSQIVREMKIGEPGKDMPRLLDLRPITELLQPPYIPEDWVVRLRPRIQAALDQYLATRPRIAPDGFVLYQAKLTSIENVYWPGFPKQSAYFSMEIAIDAGDRTSEMYAMDQPQRLDPQGTVPYDMPYITIAVSLASDATVVLNLNGILINADDGAIRASFGKRLVPNTWGDPYEEWAASDDDVKTAEDKFVGAQDMNWRSWPNKVVNAMSLNARETVNLPAGLAPDGSVWQMQFQDTVSSGLRVNMDVRKIDLAACFKQERFKNPVPIAVAAQPGN